MADHKDWTPGDVAGMVANPFYAINIDEGLVLPHEPLISEDDWVRANIGLIKELGPEAYLRHLLSIHQRQLPPQLIAQVYQVLVLEDPVHMLPTEGVSNASRSSASGAEHLLAAPRADFEEVSVAQERPASSSTPSCSRRSCATRPGPGSSPGKTGGDCPRCSGRMSRVYGRFRLDMDSRLDLTAA